MQEWVKIASSTVVGMIAGLVAEPIKATIQNRVMARHIGRVLHREVVRLEHEFSMGSALNDPKDLDRAARSLAQFKADAFDYYFTTQRGLFYSDEKLSKMRKVIEDLKELLGDPVIGRRSFHDARAWGTGLVKDSITLKIFDENLINKYRKDEDEFGTMMFFAGIGELIQEDMRPKPRTKPWAWLKGKSTPSSGRPPESQ